MSPGGGPPKADAPARGALWVVAALLLLLPTLPPETRGESLAGCAVLVVTLGALATARGLPRAGAGTLAAALALAWPLVRAASAPGAAVEPVTLGLLAGAAGLFAATFQPGLGADHRVPAALAAAGGLAGAHAVYQRLWGLAAAARALEDGQAPLADQGLLLARLREGRAYAAFATPAALGCFLALALPVTVGLAMERRGRARAALLTAAALEAVGLLATESVTATAALLVACLVAAARQRGAKTLAALTLCAAVLAGSVVLLRGGQVLSTSRPDSPWRLRAGNYRVAAEMIRESPWLGVGPGGYGEVFPRLRREGDNESRHVHDLPLELAADLGVPLGATLALAFYAFFMGPLLRRKARVPWRVGLEMGLFAFALQNLADFTAFFPSLLWTAALLRGAASDADEEGSRARAGPALAAPVLVGSLVAAAVAGLGGLAWNARIEARNTAAAGEREQALESLRHASRLAPWNPDARLFHAQALAASPAGGAELRAALVEVEAAIVASPIRPGARDLRAALRLASGDVPGAYADWCEAARLYPIRKTYAERRDQAAQRLPGAGFRSGR